MIIRRARPGERAELEEIQRRASLAVDADRAALEAHPEAIALAAGQVERGDVLVAEIEGTLVGYAALDGSALDGLFVDPPCWRQGIGTALVEAAVHEARRRGLSLVTVVAGHWARAFYESCGFAVEGDAETRFGPALRMSR